jgi:hypothetical protein
VAGAPLVFVPSIAMFVIANLMGGGDPTIGEVIYKHYPPAAISLLEPPWAVCCFSFSFSRSGSPDASVRNKTLFPN